MTKPMGVRVAPSGDETDRKKTPERNICEYWARTEVTHVNGGESSKLFEEGALYGSKKKRYHRSSLGVIVVRTREGSFKSDGAYSELQAFGIILEDNKHTPAVYEV